MSDAFIAAAIIGAVSTFLGAVSQRSTGIGLALIATPGLVLTLGPLDGVTMIIICGSTGAGVAALLVLKTVDWRMFGLVSVPGLLLSPLGAWAVLQLDAVIVQFALALLIVAALLVPLVLRGARLRHPSPVAAIVAGGALGFVNSAAGVGGPALVAYAVASDWDFARFRATAQPVFFAAGVFSIASRLLVGERGFGALELPLVLILVSTTLAGVLTGSVLADRLPISVVKRLSVAIALTGAAVVGVDALIRLVQR